MLCQKKLVTKITYIIARPLSPDVRDIRSIKAACSAPLALRNDGAVIMWPGAYGLERKEYRLILVGEIPAPWNLSNPN